MKSYFSKFGKWSALTFLVLGAFGSITVRASDTLRALFIGNSYTYVNDLPGLSRDLSASKGKRLLIDSYAPGGYSWSQHVADAACLTKIRQGGWDIVVLQEQSQMPSIDFYRYNYSAPSIAALSDSIRAYNPCADIALFMTWGRRLGGQQCINGYCSAPFADFNHMQDTLRSAYEQFAIDNQLVCSPVGMAWKKALEDPTVVLHSSDNSHPALTGSYLAACVFYSVMWGEPVTGAAFTAGLTQSQAQRFQEIADSTVYHGPSDWNIAVGQPTAQFTYTASGRDIQFYNSTSARPSVNYSWYFGDGNSSNDPDPFHSYSADGNYQVMLVADDCGNRDTFSITLNIVSTGVIPVDFKEAATIFPNPANEYVLITGLNPGTHRVTLIDAFGRIVLESAWVGESHVLGTAPVTEGAFTLLIDSSKTKKLVISR